MDIFTCAVTKGAGGGSDLPSPGASGNVLTSNGSKWGSAAPAAELPAVSAEDNGKVLGVNFGEWRKMNPRSVNNDYVVDMTIENDEPYANHDGSEISIDDIIAAHAAGKTVIMDYSGARLTLCNVAEDLVIFSAAEGTGDAIHMISWYGSVNEGMDEWTFTETWLPVPTNNDEGKVLSVVSGEYDFVSAKDPLIISASASGLLPNVTVSITDELSDIYDAAADGRIVYLEVLYEGMIPLRFPLLQYYYDEEDGYALAFEAVRNISHVPTLMTIVFEETKSTGIILTGLAAVS